MSEPWIRVHADLAGKHVVFRVVQALGVSQNEAIGLLVRFWGAMSRLGNDGHVDQLGDPQIESWAGWRGKRGRFAAFVRAQHADADGRVNEWDEYQGALETRRENDRQRQRKHRASGTRLDVTHDGCHTDVTRDSERDVRVTSAPARANETKRDETRRETTQSVLPPHDAPSAMEPARRADVETDVAERIPSVAGRLALTTLLQACESKAQWVAEMQAMMDGMPGHYYATAAELDESLCEFAAQGFAVGKPPSLAYFKGHVRRVIGRRQRPVRTRVDRGRNEPAGAAAAFGAIRALITERQQPGQAIVRFIPIAKVEALGPVIAGAYADVGGAERFLNQREELGFLLRDFERAFAAREAARVT